MSTPTLATPSQMIKAQDVNLTIPTSNAVTGLTTSTEIMIAIVPLITIAPYNNMAGDYWVSILNSTTSQLDIKFTASINQPNITGTSFKFTPIFVNDSGGTITLANILNNYSFKGYLRTSTPHPYIVVTLQMTTGLYASSSSLTFNCNAFSQSLLASDATITQLLGQNITALTGTYASNSSFVISASMTFDQITATALSTSLSAFNAASAGTAVFVTSTEYTNLTALSGTSTAGLSGTGYTATNNTDTGNVGTSSGMIAILSGKQIFAFAMNMVGSGNIQALAANPTPTGAIVYLHSNQLAGVASSVNYGVIKTPAVFNNSGYTPAIYKIAGQANFLNATSCTEYFGNGSYPLSNLTGSASSLGQYCIQTLAR